MPFLFDAKLGIVLEILPPLHVEKKIATYPRAVIIRPLAVNERWIDEYYEVLSSENVLRVLWFDKNISVYR